MCYNAFQEGGVLLNMKKLIVIDGQGGRLGKRIIERVLDILPEAEIIAVGTNSTATAEMLKGGAKKGASGENAIIVACRSADIIAGPVGIIAADALMGEMTPAAAGAVGASAAHKVLLPVSKCGITVAGVGEMNLSALINDAADIIAGLLGKA